MADSDPESQRLKHLERQAGARYERLRRHASLLPERVFVDAAECLWKEAQAALRVYETNRARLPGAQGRR